KDKEFHCSAVVTLCNVENVFTAGGKLNRCGTRVSAKWSVRSLDKGKSTKYSSSYILGDSLEVVAQSDFGTDVSNELLSAVSPRETYKALIREEKNGKETKKQYLEVWSKSTLQHCIDLTALDIHGDVYADYETAIVYVAERKQPKLEPYIKRKAEDKAKNDGSGEPVPRKGEEFLYRQDWGEQLVGKFSSVIVVCRLPDETLSVLDHLPAGDCPGQKLSGEGLAVRSPRFSPRGDLVWLQRAAGGPHHACHQLVARRHDSVSTHHTVTPARASDNRDRRSAEQDAYTQRHVHGRVLPGVAGALLHRGRAARLLHAADSGTILEITKSKNGSTSVLDVQSDVILASYSNLSTPGQLFVARLPPKDTAEESVTWIQVSDAVEAPPSVTSAVATHTELGRDSTDDVSEYLVTVARREEAVKRASPSFSALYFLPDPQPSKAVPLIVWPHGGPHSSFVDAYSLEAAFFKMLGFACVQVNYRGSTGAGQSTIDYLPGRCGDADVTDCLKATKTAMESLPIDPKNVFLFGGSHGGFLVTHLSGQYPDLYNAVVSRNPVIDVATMYNCTDINDW
ncbi:putative acylpeptide hydrolase, partial [Operophtera brumata]